MTRNRYLPPKIAGTETASSPFPSRGAAQSGKVRYERLTLTGDVHGQYEGSAETANTISPEHQQELELLALVEKSRQEGFERGLEEGRAAAFAELHDRMERWKNLVEELANLRTTMIDGYRNELLELTFCMAESIVSRDLSGDRKLIKSLLAKSLEALPTKESIQISLGPDDHQALSEWLRQLANNHPNISITTDSKLQSGDLIVNGDSGSIECVLKDRFDQVRALVRGSTEEFTS